MLGGVTGAPENIKEPDPLRAMLDDLSSDASASQSPRALERKIQECVRQYGDRVETARAALRTIPGQAPIVANVASAAIDARHVRRMTWGTLLAVVLCVALRAVMHIESSTGILIFVAVLVIIGIATLSRRNRIQRTVWNIEQRTCPACSYDLTGVEAGIGPELTEEFHFGPRRCPECGMHWPLVPPRCD